jgi:cation transport regulator ChaC
MRLDSMPADALTFVADEQHVIQPTLTLAEQAARMAVAEGALGSNADYMFRTLAAVHAAGGDDLYLEQLAALVTALQK